MRGVFGALGFFGEGKGVFAGHLAKLVFLDKPPPDSEKRVERSLQAWYNKRQTLMGEK